MSWVHLGCKPISQSVSRPNDSLMGEHAEARARSRKQSCLQIFQTGLVQATTQFRIRSLHSGVVALQAQKTVESQKLALKDQEMERGIAAQNRGRLAAAQRQLKALQWEHEVRAGPSADRRQLAGFTFLLGFQDLGKWQLAMHDSRQGIHCEGYDGSGCMTSLMKIEWPVQEEEESLHLFQPTQGRSDAWSPTGGPADVYTLSKHASINQATPIPSSCHMKRIMACAGAAAEV